MRRMKLLLLPLLTCTATLAICVVGGHAHTIFQVRCSSWGCLCRLTGQTGQILHWGNDRETYVLTLISHTFGSCSTKLRKSSQFEIPEKFDMNFAELELEAGIPRWYNVTWRVEDGRGQCGISSEFLK